MNEGNFFFFPNKEDHSEQKTFANYEVIVNECQKRHTQIIKKECKSGYYTAI